MSTVVWFYQKGKRKTTFFLLELLEETVYMGNSVSWAALVRHISKFHWCGQWLPGSLLWAIRLRQYFWRQEQCPVQQALDYECWSLLKQGNPGCLSAPTPALETQAYQLLVILSWQSTLLTGSITFPEKSDETGAIYIYIFFTKGNWPMCMGFREVSQYFLRTLSF